MRAHGSRAHRLIPYDKQFLINSCPEVKRRTVRVTAGGIKVNYRYFNCPEFRDPGLLGSLVEARYDPFDAGIAYAKVGGQWSTCYSEFHASFEGLSERAVRLTTEQLRLKDRQAGRQLPINAERLATFLAQREQDEAIAKQQMHDAEAASHRRKIQAADRPSTSQSIKSTSNVPSVFPAERAAIGSPINEPRRIRILEDL